MKGDKQSREISDEILVGSSDSGEGTEGQRQQVAAAGSSSHQQRSGTRRKADVIDITPDVLPKVAGKNVLHAEKEDERRIAPRVDERRAGGRSSDRRRRRSASSDSDGDGYRSAERSRHNERHERRADTRRNHRDHQRSEYYRERRRRRQRGYGSSSYSSLSSTCSSSSDIDRRRRRHRRGYESESSSDSEVESSKGSNKSLGGGREEGKHEANKRVDGRSYLDDREKRRDRERRDRERDRERRDRERDRERRDRERDREKRRDREHDREKRRDNDVDRDRRDRDRERRSYKEPRRHRRRHFSDDSAASSGRSSRRKRDGGRRYRRQQERRRVDKEGDSGRSKAELRQELASGDDNVGKDDVQSSDSSHSRKAGGSEEALHRDGGRRGKRPSPLRGEDRKEKSDSEDGDSDSRQRHSTRRRGDRRPRHDRRRDSEDRATREEGAERGTRGYRVAPRGDDTNGAKLDTNANRMSFWVRFEVDAKHYVQSSDQVLHVTGSIKELGGGAPSAKCPILTLDTNKRYTSKSLKISSLSSGEVLRYRYFVWDSYNRQLEDMEEFVLSRRWRELHVTDRMEERKWTLVDGRYGTMNALKLRREDEEEDN